MVYRARVLPNERFEAYARGNAGEERRRSTAENVRDGAEAEKLTFEMLVDQGNKVAREWGLVFKLPDYFKEWYLKFDIDLEKFNGDASWELPMPGSFVVDRGGIIRFAAADPDYTKRPEPTEILESLSGL